MGEPKPLDLDNEVKIPDNELAQSCFEMILRALISDEKEFDTEEEALDCIFSLLGEFKDEIKGQIKSACEFYLRYIYNPWLLWEERHEFRSEKLREFMRDIVENEDTAIEDSAMSKYNEWLFKEAFKSVLGEGETRNE